MKKALIVLAHPHSSASFCGALATVATEALQAAGFETVCRDLYAEGFDPILRYEETQMTKEDVSGSLLADIQQVLETDFFVIVHPNWWGMPPAILKGWIDRVIRQGFCYNFTEAGPVRHLEGRQAVVITTGNTPLDIEISINGDPLENLWKNIVFKTVGVDDFARLNLAPVLLSTPEQRQMWLEQVREILTLQVAKK